MSVFVISSPQKVIVPWLARYMPTSRLMSSVCPLPSTPPMPRISPACTSIEKSLRRGTLRSSKYHRCSALQTHSPISPVRSFLMSSVSWRWIIARAMSFSCTPRAICATTCPARMTVMRSPTCTTSRSLCEMKMMLFPSPLSSSMMRKSSIVSCGVSTAVGSSRMSTRAPR